MTIVKWKPAKRQFPAFPSLLEGFFNDEFPFFSESYRSSIPAVNVSEDSNAFRIELAAPGMKKDDFRIELDNGVLCISTSKEDNREEESEKYTRKEFSFHSFQRSFTLPESADAEHIDATYKDGILDISISKKEEAKQKPVKQIEIS